MGELEAMKGATGTTLHLRSEAGASQERPVLHVAPTPFFAERGCHVRIQGLLSTLNRRGQRSVLMTDPMSSDVEEIDTARIRRIPGYHREETGPSDFTYNLSFGRRVPVVFDVHGGVSGELEARAYLRRLPGLQTLFRDLEWLICRLPIPSVCSSGHRTELLARECGVRPEWVSVKADGVDPDDPHGEAGLPVVCRDTPVGREVLGEGATSSAGDGPPRSTASRRRSAIPPRRSGGPGELVSSP